VKFILGVLVGLLMGAFVLISTVGAFFGGLMVGWQIFGQEETDKSETPIDKPGHVRYQDMDAAPSTPTEETPT
jgi:hypothetical protein